MDDDFLSGESALTAFLARFEDGTWPVAEFHHAHHLAIAACYLRDDSHAGSTARDSVMDRLRTRIRLYNISQGGENTVDRGYHETLTRFWVEIVDRYMSSLPVELKRIEVARLVVAEFRGRRDLFRDYFDFDVVASREARSAWIPPVRPLP